MIYINKLMHHTEFSAHQILLSFHYYIINVISFCSDAKCAFSPDPVVVARSYRSLCFYPFIWCHCADKFDFFVALWPFLFLSFAFKIYLHHYCIKIFALQAEICLSRNRFDSFMVSVFFSRIFFHLYHLSLPFPCAKLYDFRSAISQQIANFTAIGQAEFL